MYKKKCLDLEEMKSPKEPDAKGDYSSLQTEGPIKTTSCGNEPSTLLVGEDGVESATHTGKRIQELEKALCEKERILTIVKGQLQEKLEQAKSHSESKSHTLMKVRQKLDVTQLSHDELVQYIGSLEYQVEDTERRSQRLQSIIASQSRDKHILEQALRDTKESYEANKEGYVQLVTTNTALSNQIDQMKDELENLSTANETYKQEKEMLKRKMLKTIDNLAVAKADHEKTIQQKLRVIKQLDCKLKSQLVPSELKQPTRMQNDAKALDHCVVKPKKRPPKFTPDQKIGEGCYGSVYAVNLDGTPCIAKRLLDILMGRGKEEAVCLQTKESFHEKFFHECVLLSRTNHLNVVKFIGVHFGKDKFDLTLFMEQLSTDLQKYLESNPGVTFPTKVSILHGVSSGLRYLHEECSIIHRDLTAANILLTADKRAKIADLGVSRIIDRTLSQLSKLPGTLAYMPPEALKDEPVYNQSLDIFSMGVLALYVAIQEFPEFSWDRVPDAIAAKGEGEIFKRRSLIEKMETRQPELSPLVLWCLSDNPVNRPSTVCLNIILEEIKKDCV